MARRKNVKRIDPRYFLNETVNRNDDGSRMEESDQCASCLAEAGRCTCDHTGCHSNPAGRHDCDTGHRLEEEASDDLNEDQELDADIADCEEKHGRSGAHNDLARCRNLAKNAAGVRKAESRGYVDPDLAAERERRALQNPANWQEGLNRAEELERG